MDIESPLISLLKQGVLVAFFLSFTITALMVWFSDMEKHGAEILDEQETEHG